MSSEAALLVPDRDAPRGQLLVAGILGMAAFTKLFMYRPGGSMALVVLAARLFVGFGRRGSRG